MYRFILVLGMLLLTFALPSLSAKFVQAYGYAYKGTVVGVMTVTFAVGSVLLEAACAIREKRWAISGERYAIGIVILWTTCSIMTACLWNAEISTIQTLGVHIGQVPANEEAHNLFQYYLWYFMLALGLSLVILFMPTKAFKKWYLQLSKAHA